MLVYLGHFTFEIHHERGASSNHEGTFTWTKAEPSSSTQSHCKTNRSAEARIYYNGVEHAIFGWKDSGQQKFSFQTHLMINDINCHQADDASLTQFDSQTLSPAKSGTRIFAILTIKITRWDGNANWDCTQFELLITFNAHIFGINGNMVASCYNRDQSWLFWYC